MLKIERSSSAKVPRWQRNPKHFSSHQLSDSVCHVASLFEPCLTRSKPTPSACRALRMTSRAQRNDLRADCNSLSARRNRAEDSALSPASAVRSELEAALPASERAFTPSVTWDSSEERQRKDAIAAAEAEGFGGASLAMFRTTTLLNHIVAPFKLSCHSLSAKRADTGINTLVNQSRGHNQMQRCSRYTFAANPLRRKKLTHRCTESFTEVRNLA